MMQSSTFKWVRGSCSMQQHFSEQVLSSVIATKCEKKLPEKKTEMEANHKVPGTV